MSRTISAVVLPQGSHTAPQPTLLEHNDIDAIRTVVNGAFDAITVRVSCENATCVLVGYVNDEFLLREDCDMNYLATALFQREVYGNVLVVSGTNPQTGEYDGESYDVPTWAYDGISHDVLEETASAYNNALALQFALRFGPRMGILSKARAKEVRKMMDDFANAMMGEGDAPEYTPSDSAFVEYLTAWAKWMMLTVQERMDAAGILDSLMNEEELDADSVRRAFDEIVTEAFGDEEGE